MIGTSLSGVTFISVPGTVKTDFFSYFQVVIGYLIGYFIIAYVLLPLYYRLNLTSIYNYLLNRFGAISYKTGAFFFILSRVMGATLRLYLVINVLQIFVLDALHIPFGVTAFIILLMILLYTFEGGVKTIVWTDTLQTTFMLLSLVVCVIYILSQLSLSFGSALHALGELNYTRIFITDMNDSRFFLKQIIGGAFVTVTMTGLDQEMMQKNISVSNLKDSQKNMITFSFILVLVNFIFLFLGGLLYLFAASNGIKATGDDLFPTVALQFLPPAIGIMFIIGLISALFPSADGAITALTSSFCIDILGIKRRIDLDEKQRKRIRMTVHLGFAVVFLIAVIIFKIVDNKSIISFLLRVASYTYGPLLGLFAFGILTRRSLKEKWVPLVCVLAPALCYALNVQLAGRLGSFRFGLELLLINGLFTYLGLLIISQRRYPPAN
jgi:Na+/proline symporter